MKLCVWKTVSTSREGAVTVPPEYTQTHARATMRNQASTEIQHKRRLQHKLTEVTHCLSSPSSVSNLSGVCATCSRPTRLWCQLSNVGHVVPLSSLQCAQVCVTTWIKGTEAETKQNIQNHTWQQELAVGSCHFHNLLDIQPQKISELWKCKQKVTK